MTGTAATTAGSGEQRVFAQRLELFLEQLNEGATPNSGRFCTFCYNPLPAGFDRCDHCGRETAQHPPLTSLPGEVLQMYRQKQKRESLVVNSFAYLGLALGLALFLGLVAINVLLMDRALWFFIMATVVFLVGSRLLAGLLGGVIGDEIGYRYANRKLAEEWAAHLAARDTSSPA
jgi:hypothetical protein